MQYNDNVINVPVVAQRQIPMVQTKAAEVAQVQDIDKIADVPAVCQRQEPIITTAQKTVEVHQIQSLA